MSKLEISQIREMSSEERYKRLEDLRTEMLRYKTLVHSGGAIENPAKILSTRKTIARILTIINEEKKGKNENGN